MPPLPRYLAYLSLLLVLGCFRPGPSHTKKYADLGLAVISSGTTCSGPSEPGLEWITENSRLSAAAGHGFATKKPTAPPRVDFKTFGVLRVSMGQKPTGGYDLALADPAARRRGQTLVIRLDWIEPDPEAMVVQMITSPCLLIRVPRGDYRRLEVRDQHGTRRYGIDIQ